MNGIIEQMRLLAPVLAGALISALMNWTNVTKVATMKRTTATMARTFEGVYWYAFQVYVLESVVLLVIGDEKKKTVA